MQYGNVRIDRLGDSRRRDVHDGAPTSRDGGVPVTETKGDAANTTEVEGPLVLVVDDDGDSRDAARWVLEQEGYNVEVAPNGEVALQRLGMSPRPTLLLLDLMMPVMDGTALLDAIESSADLSAIPIILMTASRPDAPTSGLQYPLLRKPFGVEALMSLVMERAPRLWDDDEATDEISIIEDRPSAVGDATSRMRCTVCDARASTRCTGCGEAFCRPCIDAGPDGRCPKCWRDRHR
jgi:CheY-like chemotaxis protein